MKRVLGTLALAAALLFTAAAPANRNMADRSCMTTEDLVLHVEDFDESALGNNDANFFGTIHNTSQEHGYDDVIVRVDYFDEQDVLIDSETIKIHRDIDPGESESFKSELNPPAEASNAAWSVDCAEDDIATTERLKFWEHNW